MSAAFHSFSVRHAEDFGVDEAIMLHSFAWWLGKARVEGRVYLGRAWTRGGHEALSGLFPYWTARQVERILGSLVASGVLLREVISEKDAPGLGFNATPYDRTAWFAFANEPAFLGSGTSRGDAGLEARENVPCSHENAGFKEREPVVQRHDSRDTNKDLVPGVPKNPESTPPYQHEIQGTEPSAARNAADGGVGEREIPPERMPDGTKRLPEEIRDFLEDLSVRCCTHTLLTGPILASYRKLFDEGLTCADLADLTSGHGPENRVGSLAYFVKAAERLVQQPRPAPSPPPAPKPRRKVPRYKRASGAAWVLGDPVNAPSPFDPDYEDPVEWVYEDEL